VPALRTARRRARPAGPSATQRFFSRRWSEYSSARSHAGTRVDQQLSSFAAKGNGPAGLVTTNAGIDFIALPAAALLNEVGIGQKRPGHGDHIRIAFASTCSRLPACLIRLVVNQRDTDLALELGSHLGKGRARGTLVANGAESALMPAECRC